MFFVIKKLSLIFLLLIITIVNSNSNIEEINKIDKQIESIDNLFKAGAMDNEEYDKIKSRLLIKKNKLKNQKTTEGTGDNKNSITLNKQIEVLTKLFEDGVISEEEFKKSKSFLQEKENLGENIDLQDYKKRKIFEYDFVYQKDPGKKSWEKTEIIYKNFKILPYRPGGIKIVRLSDNKKLFHIVDNFKYQYFNGGEQYITTKEKVYNIYTGLDVAKNIEKAKKDISKSFKSLKKVLNNPFGKKEKAKWDPEAHKLQLFIDGAKILTFEGRYVSKHKAFFYQVLTPRNEAFHYYIKLGGRTAIALNMEIFNIKIDAAIRKAKTRLSEEYNVTEDEIQKIIDKKLNEIIDDSVDDAVEKEMEKAINQSVQEAIEKSIGQATSESIVDAIEQATGEAIDQALEDELAQHIDNEIERAIQDGIEEAAVAAGFEAYYDTLLAGGSVEEALKNASDACGAGCEFVLE